MIRKILIVVVFVFLGITSLQTYAANQLLGGQFPNVNGNTQRFFTQESISSPLTQAQCLGDRSNQRYYLSHDLDGDGLPDRGDVLYPRDNFLYAGSGRGVALLTVRDGSTNGTLVQYYLPQTNMVQFYNNGSQSDLSQKRIWYRYSKVAPKNQPVRAVTSEPVLYEAPASRNASDAMFQFVYSVRFSPFVSWKNENNKDYFVGTIPHMNYFDGVPANAVWYMKAGLGNPSGPLWNNDYINQTTPITNARAIQRGNEFTHTFECSNTYLSRCGDGFIDKSGQQPTNGTTTQPYAIADPGINEACDPGKTPSDIGGHVMPGGQPATANRYCSPTCTIVDIPVGPAELTIDKQQKLSSSSSYQGVGFGTPSDIEYDSPSNFDFKIIIKNIGESDAHNVVMHDTLPVGFTLNSCSAVGGVENSDISVACNTPSGGGLTSQSFTLAPGKQAVFVIKGSLAHTDPTTNEARATSNEMTTEHDSVDQHPHVNQMPHLIIDKQQKLETGPLYVGAGFGTPSDIEYDSPSRFNFKIVITNNGAGDAHNVQMRDKLPLGFVMDDLPGGCSGTIPGVADIQCNSNFISNPDGSKTVMSHAFTLQAGKTATFIIKGELTSDNPTINEARAISDEMTTEHDSVNQHPSNNPSGEPDLTIDKVQKKQGDLLYQGAGLYNPISSGSGIGYSNIAYDSPSMFYFKITVQNKGSGLAQQVQIFDNLPMGFTVDPYVINNQNPSINEGCYVKIITSTGNVLQGCVGVSIDMQTGQKKIASVPFDLEPNQRAELYIKGMLTNIIETTNETWANYKDIANNTHTTLHDYVYQHPNEGNTAGALLTIDKQQKLSSWGTDAYSGVGLYTPSNIGYDSPAEFDFKIIITNIGSGTAENVKMIDRLPNDFDLTDCYGEISTPGTIGEPPLLLQCTDVYIVNSPGDILNNGIFIASADVFDLGPNKSATFYIKGTLHSHGPTINAAWATYEGGITPIDAVKQHPNDKDTDTYLVYTKTVRNTTTHSNEGNFVEADTHDQGVIVHTGDSIEYQITLWKHGTGALSAVGVRDILPTNGGFIMDHYSITPGLSGNDAPTIIESSEFIPLDITTAFNALDDGESLVITLYGTVATSVSANSFVNTALITVDGLPAQTLTPGSNVAWTITDHYNASAKLHLEKYRINPANPNQTGDYYVVDSDTPITFVLRVTNVGSIDAVAVLHDVCPLELKCLSYHIEPQISEILYPQSGVIPVGTVAVGSYVDVIVRAIAYPNGITSSSSRITNIAKLYRECSLEEDTSDGVQDGLCHENDDDAILDPKTGAAICGDGIKDRGEQCDLGPTLPQIIGNYLDLSTDFPSANHRGKLCNSQCEIVDTSLNYCGDGILGRLEQCDMGSHGGTIGAYLDVSGTVPSGVYEGQWCSNSCVIDGDIQPTMPACWYTDTIISVMKDEYLPFSWDIEFESDDLVNSCSNGEASNGKILKNSLTCDFALFNKNNEIVDQPSWLKNLDCNINMRNSNASHATTTSNTYPLFRDFRNGNDPLFVQNPFGTFYLTPTQLQSLVDNNLGEYKISLEKVNYQYCQNGRAITGSPYARVCQINFAITDHYIMQEGATATLTNTNLSNYYDIAGKSLYSLTDLDKINQVSQLNYAQLSPQLTTLTNNLIAKYEALAVSVPNQSSMKKVPGQNIYIVDGNASLKFDEMVLHGPASFIVKGNTKIYGSSPDNVLIISQGKTSFELYSPSGWRNGCEAQTLNGIVIALGGFTESMNGYINNDLEQPRCRKGNLLVNGALVGKDLINVVESRRSHLEGWFTATTNGSILNDSRVKAERRDKVMYGASVSISQNPSLWRQTPPGANEFLNTLNISRN